MSEHKQIEVDGVEVDEGLCVFLQLVWKHGLITSDSCQGGGITDKTAVAYIVFPEVNDALEFLSHSAHITDYLFGDNMALTVIHPDEDLTAPARGKVSWLPSLTLMLTNAWSGRSVT